MEGRRRAVTWLGSRGDDDGHDDGHDDVGDVVGHQPDVRLSGAFLLHLHVVLALEVG